VLRHYRRGGFVARFSTDRYLWLGEEGVRAFREWRLLAWLWQRGLPVPKPIAAWYQRSGPSYRCDLITRRIPNTQTLSAALAAHELSFSTWHSIGAVIARLHHAGVDHADLNAHNILLDNAPADSDGAVSVIDFDRGRLRNSGAWTEANLKRLHRSLTKISRAMPARRFTQAAWDSLMVGYQSARLRALPDTQPPASHPPDAQPAAPQPPNRRTPG
jgi:3-deoxy-D-manno-octulosonic acid kinase